MSLSSTAEQLMKRGFTPIVVPTKQLAIEKCLELIGGASVGFGGSVTTQTLGLYDLLKERGNPVFWHWKAKPENVPETLKKASEADYYVCSANAITADGVLVNVDGRGNRVAALATSARIIVIAGSNKLAEDLPAALSRIKTVAAPLNARRLNLQTPCAITGKCADCRSAQRMCNVTSILEAPTASTKFFYVILVEEEIGF